MDKHSCIDCLLPDVRIFAFSGVLYLSSVYGVSRERPEVFQLLPVTNNMRKKVFITKVKKLTLLRSLSLVRGTDRETDREKERVRCGQIWLV